MRAQGAYASNTTLVQTGKNVTWLKRSEADTVVSYERS